MKKATGTIIVIIIFLVVALLGMVLYLGIFSNGAFKSWDLLSSLTCMNDPVELHKDGDAAYKSGDYASVIKSYKRLLVKNIAYEESRKIKKLLVAIAQSVPFTPNIKKLSERLGINRTFLINAIKLLNRADLVMELYKPTKGD